MLATDPQQWGACSGANTGTPTAFSSLSFAFSCSVAHKPFRRLAQLLTVPVAVPAPTPLCHAAALNTFKFWSNVSPCSEASDSNAPHTALASVGG